MDARPRLLGDWLRRHGVPRGIGAGIVFLAIVAIGCAVGLLVLTGIASQAESLSESLRAGASEVESLLRDLGVSASTAADANADGSSSISASFEALTHGLIGGIDKLASLAVFLSFTALSLFFMLKDGPTIGGFVERHLGVPPQLGHSILGRVASSLRGYFLGVTVVAAWSALLVGAGALLLDVPLAGTIAAVTFVGLRPLPRRLDGRGLCGVDRPRGPGPRDRARARLRRPPRQRGPAADVQPIAYGAALKLHPLAVLIVTIAGGCLFGTVGLVLAAPLLSAAIRISSDVKAAQEDAPVETAPSEGQLTFAGAAKG